MRCAAETGAPRLSFVVSVIRRETAGMFGPTVARLPAPDLGVQGRRGHTISGRKLNLFKPLRRHFQISRSPGERRARLAVRLPRAALPATETPPLQETDDRLLPPDFRHAPRPLPLKAAAAGIASTEPDARPSHSGATCRTNIEQDKTSVKKLLAFWGWENRRRFPLPSQRRMGFATHFTTDMPTSNSRAYGTTSCIVWFSGQRELKDGPAGRIGARPQSSAVRFDYGTADRQPQPQAIWFGRVESLE